jgi:hypothetical protein
MTDRDFYTGKSIEELERIARVRGIPQHKIDLMRFDLAAYLRDDDYDRDRVGAGDE